jgi:hypothetical protein
VYYVAFFGVFYCAGVGVVDLLFGEFAVSSRQPGSYIRNQLQNQASVFFRIFLYVVLWG